MMTLAQAESAIKDLLEGRLETPEAILAVFDAMVGSKANILGELSKLTKKGLKGKISGHVWSDEKKHALVEKAWDTLVFGLNPATSWSMQLGTRESIESIIRRHIEKATVESIAAYVAEVRERRESYLKAVKAKLEEMKAEKEAENAS